MDASVTLAWPDKVLSPNARSHFRVKAAAAKSYREAAHWLTLASKLAAPADGPVVLHLRFCPPDKRARDLDNMLASVKAGLDGIADGLEVNDHRFGLLLTRAEPVKGGAVVVSVISG